MHIRVKINHQNVGLWHLTMVIELCFKLINTLPVTNHFFCSIRTYLSCKKSIMEVFVIVIAFNMLKVMASMGIITVHISLIYLYVDRDW